MVFRNRSKSLVEQTKTSHLIQKQQHFCSEVIFVCLGEDLADLQMIYCLLEEIKVYWTIYILNWWENLVSLDSC